MSLLKISEYLKVVIKFNINLSLNLVTLSKITDNRDEHDDVMIIYAVQENV